MKKTLLALAIALPFAQPGLADYQAELRYSHDNTDVEPSAFADFEQDTDTLVGTVYLQSIDGSIGPYQELAFLNKASSLFIGYDDFDDGVSRGTDTTLSYGTRLVLQDKWIVDVSASDSEDAAGNSINTYTLGGGLYVTEFSALTFEYTKREEDAADSDADTYELRYKRTTRELAGGHYYNFDAVYLFDDDDILDETHGLELGADFYLDKHFSIGGVLGYADNDQLGDIIEYGVRTAFYINDRLGLSFRYVETDNDDADAETWVGDLVLRF